MKKLAHHLFIALILTCCTLMVALGVFIVWVVGTTPGAKFVLELGLRSSAIPMSYHIGQWSGNLWQGLHLTDITIIPNGSKFNEWVIKGQALDLMMRSSWHPRHWQYQLFNWRLLKSGQEPIVLTGSMNNGLVDLRIFSPAVDLSLVELIAGDRWLNARFLSGFVMDVDIALKGHWPQVKTQGNGWMDWVKYKTTMVRQGQGRWDLFINFLQKPMDVYGEVTVFDGQVQTRHLNFDLGQSKVYYDGQWENPRLDIHGSTVMEKIAIDLGFKGTLKNPQLMVSSDPPYPEDMVLVMLATGKTWKSSSTQLSQGAVSGELVADFFDFMVLGGQGGSFAKQLGITDFTARYDQEEKKVGIKKSLNQQMRLGIEIEQLPRESNQQPQYSQKLQGEVDVTDNLSVNISQKVKPEEQEHLNAQTPANVKESEILLKYQKSF